MKYLVLVYWHYLYRRKKCDVTFVSEWEWTLDETGRIETKAILNLKDGSLSIETSDMGCDGIIKEYITLNDRQYPVEEFQGEWKVSFKSLKAIKSFLNKT